MTKYSVNLAIIDTASAKSYVNCPKKKVYFWLKLTKKGQKHNTRKGFKTYRPNPLC